MTTIEQAFLEALEFIEDQEDVVDGPDGVQQANDAMQIALTMRAALAAQPSQPQYPGRIELVMPCGDPRQVRIVTTDRKYDGTLQLCIEVDAQPSQPQDALRKEYERGLEDAAQICDFNYKWLADYFRSLKNPNSFGDDS